MKYKGQEIKELEFTEAQVFDPPKRLLVWDGESGNGAHEDSVYAVLPDREPSFRVITHSGAYGHCAEIPKPCLATNRELSRWLAEGKGELRFESNCRSCYTYFTYLTEHANVAVESRFLVRRWDDTDWHSPTRKYLGLESQ